MHECRVKIINRLGLHARAAAKLVRIAGEFQSEITVTNVNKSITADGKSILELLTLCASEGTELAITASGMDEEDAIRKLVRIFEDGFGEQG